MGETFYVLKNHAAAALGIDPDAVDLPRCGYGFSGDALWTDPRFVEIRRQREAIANQFVERRFNFHHSLHKPRTEEEKEATLARTRQRRYARKKLQRKAKSKRIVPAVTPPFSVAAWAAAHGMVPYDLRQKLRAAGRRAPYSLDDVERVLPAFEVV